MIKKILSLSLLVVFTTAMVKGQDDAVEQLFALKCGICHTIGSGRLVGPDLKNVHEKYSEEWLLEYVRSSQAMIKKGDPDAVAIFEEYNGILMPDPLISDDEILSILGYIAESSAAGGKAGAAYESVLTGATSADAEHGQELFEGRIRFENDGPSCISCHNIQRKETKLLTNYAKDVMASFETLGEAGVSAIIKTPPYPVMAEAFKGHDLTEAERHDLLAYLKDAKAQAPNMGLSSMYSNFFSVGLMGGVFLFVLYSLFWFNRKGGSVNEKIYKRQMKSAN
ncbi:MAG: hypothetical protein DRI69_07305 [Bacteroidetes bacterium]|nr:MAG: hypothetical protein DRI69_07305 [Bacteroidota bacterium]